MPDETIRVAVSKLDDLMAQAGELFICKISAEPAPDRRARHARALHALARRGARSRPLLPRRGDTGRRLAALARHYEYLQTLTRESTP